MSFSGKTVLITGGVGGLGIETAKKFYEQKAMVILLDKNQELLNEAAKELPGVQTIYADLSNWVQTREALQAVKSVDHLVNNAGVVCREAFMDVKPESIDFVFGVNFKAIVNVSQVIAAKMAEKGGTIVNISSIAGKRALPGLQNSVYSASKAAVLSMTQCMAAELGPKIRVSAVCPTAMITSFNREFITKNAEFYSGVTGRGPIKRFLDPKDTADAILFLSSNASSMMTGTSLDVDGGYLAV